MQRQERQIRLRVIECCFLHIAPSSIMVDIESIKKIIQQKIISCSMHRSETITAVSEG